MKKNLLLFSLYLLIYPLLGMGQSESAFFDHIKKETDEKSKVMEIAAKLTEHSGPRLTNSPGYFRAANLAMNEMKSWGMTNVRMEPWGEFGRGWSFERCHVSMEVPYHMSIIAVPLAWTRGTNGIVKGAILPVSSLQVDSLKPLAAKIKGKFILPQFPKDIPSPFNPNANRLSDSSLGKMQDNYMVSEQEMDMMVTVLGEWKKAVRFLEENGAAGLLYMTQGDRDGTLNASAWFSGKKGAAPELTALNLAPEHYHQLQRLAEKKVAITISVDIKTTFHDKDLQGYNVLGEIEGTDPELKNEVVLLGAHLDSWHAGTGATDNAAGCAVMLEAARMIKAMGEKPKRTIRIALWGGEEQGLLGSHGYASKHYGDPSTMKLLPDQKKVSAYYNLDNGSGAIRGIYTQGNEVAGEIFKTWFKEMGLKETQTVSNALTGSTDHLSFDALGIPAFQFIQDPLEYESKTHHTNMDTFDHLFPDDLKQACNVMTYFALKTANATSLIPRKTLPKPSTWIWDRFF